MNGVATCCSTPGCSVRRVGIFLALSCFLLQAAASASAAAEPKDIRRPPWTGNRVVGSPNPPAPYLTHRLFPSIRFEGPVDLARLPGTDRWVVAENGGRFFSFSTRGEPGAQRAELLFDVRRHHPGFDNVLGFAFHPGFATNRWIFINYNEEGNRPEGSFVARFQFRSLEPPALDPASEQVILRWPSGGHNGCTLAFGTDGTLFVSTGDSANPEPPDGVAKTGQDISDLLGSVLRLDVDHPEPGRAYGIPKDNPFRHLAGARPEVYAFGFRNPFRMSVDPATGDVWVGDVGWEQWEMIYRLRPGGNYGWPITEGPNRQVRTDITPGPGPIEPPLAAHPHSEAASITGGRVYHGQRLTRLRGAYVYGDWESGKFWALRQDGTRATQLEELCDTTLKPVAFAEDAEGELVILDHSGGGLHAFATNSVRPTSQEFPRQLSATGIFRDVASLTPAPGVVPYAVQAPMWSDGASVERLVGVPGSDSISPRGGRETIAGRMWYFPSNTVFARTLTWPGDAVAGVAARRLETQLLHFDGQGWNAYSYRWNAEQTDAELVPESGTNTVVTIPDPTAAEGRHEFRWRYLSRTECLRCHNVWAGDLLGFNPLQLGRGATDTEATRLRNLGVLASRNKRDEDPAPTLTNPYLESAPLEARARSWLHVNCAGCHRFGAGGGANVHFNLEKPPAEWRALDERPTRGDFGIPGARIIAPGNPYRSILLHRTSSENSIRMPHVGSLRVDEVGVQLLSRWIRSLPAPAEDRSLAELEAVLDRLERVTSSNQVAAAISPLLASLDSALGLFERLNPAARSAAAAPAARAALAAWLRPAALTLARNHTNTFVRDLYQRLLPPSERRQTLGQDFASELVLQRSGDALRGQELFLGAAQCARCHARNGLGRAFGPDLTDLPRRYPRDQILDHIRHPSKLIAPEYHTVQITLKNEHELVGFVVRRDAAEWVLKDADLALHTIKASEVVESRESQLSAMPEGLLQGLTAQEAADLLAFLTLAPRE